MKKLSLQSLCLILCLCLIPLMALAESKDINSTQAAEILKNPPKDLMVLDIRTPKEFISGHIEGAIMIDFMSPDFEEKLLELDKNKPYIMHCRTGARSARAKVVMENLGFTHVLHMTDGIMGWIHQGLPVAK